MSDDLIRLDNSRNARAFDEDERLWAKELARIIHRIDEHVQSIEQADHKQRSARADGESREHRPFLSVGIFGPSGSGKSSLLRTLVRIVNHGGARKVEDELRDLSGIEYRVAELSMHALPVMQPDRFAEHDHFLYAFLAKALKAEKDDRERRGGEGQDPRDYEPDALSPVQQSFQELSDFLRVVDKPETSSDYDPLGLSLERLERHTSALLLQEKMEQFIDSLADQFGRKGGSRRSSVILLAVDDVDMSPEHLVTALKVYQTYLLHPRLVPVFTFTDRTAEEILRGYFRNHLFSVTSSSTARGADGPDAIHRPGIIDQLALQYLARCFPVRNRLRLGPAPERLRDRVYVPSSTTDDHRKPVKTLLEAASQLLYGTSDREMEHRVWASLRPSTLRRQFHVVDEMHSAGVGDYIFRAGGGHDGEEVWCVGRPSRAADPQEKVPGDRAGSAGVKPPRRKRWVQVFDSASWSLMNVHRDILREYDLYLEDLYSWTPRGLQRTLLETILSQPIEKRRALLRRWRHRLSSRRGGTLSLLAANTFRPWMPGEEPTGDSNAMRTYDRDELDSIVEGDTHLSATTALIWYLHLTIGFYHPQVLAWNRPNDIALTDPSKGRVVGLGWTLRNGPVNAVRAAEQNDSMAAAGILFLDPERYAKGLEWAIDSGKPSDKPKEQHEEAVLLLKCWTYYGYSRGRYWAAVSFWRGLGLIGLLLKARRDLEIEWGPEKASGELQEDFEEELGKRVSALLRDHLVHGMVPGELMGEGETGGCLDYAFRRWDLSKSGWENNEQKTKLEKDLTTWLLGLQNVLYRRDPAQSLIPLIPIYDEPPASLTEKDLKNWKDKFGIQWSESLLRRVHGDEIVGDLLTRLNATLIEDHELFKDDLYGPEQEEESKNSGQEETGGKRNYLWSAGIAMTNWTRVFLDHWRGIESMQELLRDCPLLTPFTEGPQTDRIRNEILKAHLPNNETDEVRQSIEGKEVPATRALDWVRNKKGINTQRLAAFKNEMQSQGFDLNAESSGKDRFEKRLGRKENYWPAETRQICSVLESLSALALFHRLPRVRPKKFKPASPFGS